MIQPEIWRLLLIHIYTNNHIEIISAVTIYLTYEMHKYDIKSLSWDLKYVNARSYGISKLKSSSIKNVLKCIFINKSIANKCNWFNSYINSNSYTNQKFLTLKYVFYFNHLVSIMAISENDALPHLM